MEEYPFPVCYICKSTNLEENWICDRCDQLYCEDCSYTFTLHYQFQGSRCYHCADQHRRNGLTKEEVYTRYENLSIKLDEFNRKVIEDNRDNKIDQICDLDV